MSASDMYWLERRKRRDEATIALLQGLVAAGYAVGDADQRRVAVNRAIELAEQALALLDDRPIAVTVP